MFTLVLGSLVSTLVTTIVFTLVPTLGGISLISLVAKALKGATKISKTDLSNPLTQDTVSFIVDIAKEIIKPF